MRCRKASNQQWNESLILASYSIDVSKKNVENLNSCSFFEAQLCRDQLRELERDLEFDSLVYNSKHGPGLREANKSRYQLRKLKNKPKPLKLSIFNSQRIETYTRQALKQLKEKQITRKDDLELFECLVKQFGVLDSKLFVESVLPGRVYLLVINTRAKLIQHWWKKKSRQLQRQRNNCSVSIQKTARYYLSRKQFLQLKREKLENDSKINWMLTRRNFREMFLILKQWKKLANSKKKAATLLENIVSNSLLRVFKQWKNITEEIAFRRQRKMIRFAAERLNRNAQKCFYAWLSIVKTHSSGEIVKMG